METKKKERAKVILNPLAKELGVKFVCICCAEEIDPEKDSYALSGCKVSSEGRPQCIPCWPWNDVLASLNKELVKAGETTMTMVGFGKKYRELIVATKHKILSQKRVMELVEENRKLNSKIKEIVDSNESKINEIQKELRCLTRESIMKSWNEYFHTRRD